MTLAIDRVDLIVLATYLLSVVLFGLWMGRGVKSLSAFWLGDRKLAWWAILGSIVATETSTATFLSVPGIAFAPTGGDLRFLQLTLGFLVGRIVIVWLLLPRYFEGQIYTAYELLDERFGGATKVTASIVFLVTRNLGDGLRLFLTAIALEKVVGVPLPLCVTVIGVATIAYTFFGGMKAVVWNDCLQFVVYMVGGVVAGAVILNRLPAGVEQFVSYAQTHQKLRVLDFSLSASEPYTLWAGLIGGMFLSLGTHGTDQMMVQRYLCAASVREAGRALIASGLVIMVQFTLFLLLGIGLACFYDAFPPERAFATGDHVLATFIVEDLPVGLTGIVLAAVFAAAMSTLSSSLNSSTTSAVNDLIVPLMERQLSGPTILSVSRGLTVVFGLIQILIGIAAAHLSNSVVEDALAIAGFSAGLLLGLFALGILTPSVRQRSALCGFVVGLVALTGLRFGLPAIDRTWTMAWPWYPVVGSLTTFTSALLHRRMADPIG